jgi:hypothetical protein
MGIPFIWGTLLAPSTILYGCGTADGNVTHTRCFRLS